jgi:hypothetical protein
MNVRCALRAMLVALFAASCAKAPEQIEVVTIARAAATPSTTRTVSYEAILTDVLNALEQDTGLPRVDVSLVLFPSRDAFERGLLEIGYSKALARSASSFNAIGGARAVLVNAAIVNRMTRTQRVRLIAHEVVHSIQYHLGGGVRGASEQWLREGFAEWVACRVTAHLGLDSFDSLRNDLLEGLAAPHVGLRPAPLDKLATFRQWVEAQGRYDTPLYSQAFIAAELLVEEHGVPAMIRYFEYFKGTQDRERGFTEAFGIERASFERAFMRRWHQTVSRARVLRGG